MISRTFHDEEGQEFVRDEVVKRPDVINAYIQLSSEVRSKFVDQDQETREGMKKMKRKLVYLFPSLSSLPLPLINPSLLSTPPSYQPLPHYSSIIIATVGFKINFAE